MGAAENDVSVLHPEGVYRPGQDIETPHTDSLSSLLFSTLISFFNPPPPPPPLSMTSDIAGVAVTAEHLMDSHRLVCAKIPKDLAK